jgi:DNA-binding NarL/FixJ family response regulator
MSTPPAALFSVIIVGGSGELLASLRAMLREEPGYSLAGEAKTCAAAIDLALRCQPAVALIVVCLPDGSGFEVVRCMGQLVPGCATILMSDAPDPCVEEVALLLGAKAVWQKRDGLDKLRQTLRRLIPAKPSRPFLFPSFQGPAT